MDYAVLIYAVWKAQFSTSSYCKKYLVIILGFNQVLLRTYKKEFTLNNTYKKS